MIAERKKAKALLLFSGGLDSLLAAKILERQGINVVALTFESYFFTAEQAKKSARANGLRLQVENFPEKHLKIVKIPRFGRGAGMNPCIDCHLLMLREAKKMATREKFDIIATGEVLGQRPMSQNLGALRLIEREAGLVGKILRPLSACVLPATEYEESGIVDRERLVGISGRGRKEQIELAKKYGIRYYPTPAGGCILTDKEFSKKLSDLLERVKKTKPGDFALLRIGRHFWVDKAKIILGRNHEENLKLKKMAESGDILIEPKELPGPTALIRGGKGDEIENAAKKLIKKYAKEIQKDILLKITKK